MTRKRRHEIERDVESLKANTDDRGAILFVQETDDGELIDLDGSPVSETAVEHAGLIFTYTSPPEKHTPETDE